MLISHQRLVPMTWIDMIGGHTVGESNIRELINQQTVNVSTAQQSPSPPAPPPPPPVTSCLDLRMIVSISHTRVQEKKRMNTW